MHGLGTTTRRALWLVFIVLLPGLLVGMTMCLIEGSSVRGDPGIIYVDTDATGLNNGTSWDHAYTELQSALGAAASGAEIWVAEGVYYPDEGPGQIDGDAESTFTLTDGVAVYGGFSGDEEAREARDWTANVTVLSGDIGGDDGTDAHGVVTDTANITGTNAFHVVTGGGVTETAVLDGFTITAGSAHGPDYYQHAGGGLYNQSSSPVLNNVIFRGNSAEWTGGGIYNGLESNPKLTSVIFSGNQARDGGGLFNYRSSPTLTDVIFNANRSSQGGGGMYNRTTLGSLPKLNNVIFTDNRATWYGGGMYNYDHSSAVLSNVIFSNNTAENGDGGGMRNRDSMPMLDNVTFSGNDARNGGGMDNKDSNPTLTDVSFTGNTADEGDGGGMHNSDSSPRLVNVTFSGNDAQNGGGMDNENSSPTLTGVSFTGNTADEGDGGGMHNHPTSSPVLTNVTFFSNTATVDGGGMANGDNSDPQLTNATFSGNYAHQYGGGLYSWQSQPTLTNVTFSGNRAGSNGGGVCSSSSSPTLVNCILWGNLASSAEDQIFNIGPCSPTVSYSDIQGGCDAVVGNVCGDGNIDEDPLFVAPAAASSAPTTTGDYRLRPLSPAVDAGHNEAVPTAVITDLDGRPRFVDGDGDGDPEVDMGPYEVPLKAYLPLVLLATG